MLSPLWHFYTIHGKLFVSKEKIKDSELLCSKISWSYFLAVLWFLNIKDLFLLHILDSIRTLSFLSSLSSLWDYTWDFPLYLPSNTRRLQKQILSSLSSLSPFHLIGMLSNKYNHTKHFNLQFTHANYAKESLLQKSRGKQANSVKVHTNTRS